MSPFLHLFLPIGLHLQHPHTFSSAKSNHLPFVCSSSETHYLSTWSARQIWIGHTGSFFLICLRQLTGNVSVVADLTKELINKQQDATTVWVGYYSKSDIEHLSCRVSCSLKTECKSHKYTWESSLPFCTHVPLLWWTYHFILMSRSLVWHWRAYVECIEKNSDTF